MELAGGCIFCGLKCGGMGGGGSLGLLGSSLGVPGLLLVVLPLESMSQMVRLPGEGEYFLGVEAQGV